jgi:hypothetical protein
MIRGDAKRVGAAHDGMGVCSWPVGLGPALHRSWARQALAGPRPSTCAPGQVKRHV